MEKPLVDKQYLLEKFPGKSGWTYAEIPELQIGNRSFGMLKVKGSIDGFEVANFHLMPKGNGNLMITVKTEIRKAINKQAGDWVHIVLYSNDEPLVTLEDFLLCLRDEPEALRFYQSLNENEQQDYVKWIFSAKAEQTKVERIAKTLDRLAKNQKYHKE
ncbi:YdeI/OmpD-associated family protein [Parabacteroides sp. PF5-9]|uniref:YdeI/OmpD-associated family protein n=1 Tax=Parabacteroides sp. PF5-9 TaxID=1742404 RepID=UPI0024742EF5|nr:YdeI/OmpD-associated family protein [Parabacteroides sp. PF5-9]